MPGRSFSQRGHTRSNQPTPRRGAGNRATRSDRKFLRRDVALTGHRHILTPSEPRPAKVSPRFERDGLGSPTPGRTASRRTRGSHGCAHHTHARNACTRSSIRASCVRSAKPNGRLLNESQCWIVLRTRPTAWPLNGARRSCDLTTVWNGSAWRLNLAVARSSSAETKTTACIWRSTTAAAAVEPAGACVGCFANVAPS